MDGTVSFRFLVVLQILFSNADGESGVQCSATILLSFFFFLAAPGPSSPPTTAIMMRASTLSFIILCRTASLGMLIRIILRYWAATASSSLVRTIVTTSLSALAVAPLPSTASMILTPILSLIILFRTASRGMEILSILRYCAAIFSSAGDNDRPDDLVALSASGPRTTIRIFSLTESRSILCRTASRGIDTLSIFWYLVATSCSSSVRLDAPSAVGGEASSLFD
mmetsp:Transcript_17574/g.50272  ORF Transcript_17574/g.50272 Transcript_17574/m.50272 type:complete len:225 (+) Transcript_17574:2997-3671(+)